MYNVMRGVYTVVLYKTVALALAQSVSQSVCVVELASLAVTGQ